MDLNLSAKFRDRPSLILEFPNHRAPVFLYSSRSRHVSVARSLAETVSAPMSRRLVLGGLYMVSRDWLEGAARRASVSVRLQELAWATKTRLSRRTARSLRSADSAEVGRRLAAGNGDTLSICSVSSVGRHATGIRIPTTDHAGQTTTCWSPHSSRHRHSFPKECCRGERRVAGEFAGEVCSIQALAIVARFANQILHRNAETLAFDVPSGKLDADHAHLRNAAGHSAQVAVPFRVQFLDGFGVIADEQRLQVFDQADSD